MRRKVTFQTRATTVDEFGQESLTWEDNYTTGADIRQVTFRETNGAELQVASGSLRLLIPYSEKGLALTTKDSAVIAGMRYRIENLDFETMFRRKITVTCTQYNET